MVTASCRAERRPATHSIPLRENKPLFLRVNLANPPCERLGIPARRQPAVCLPRLYQSGSHSHDSASLHPVAEKGLERKFRHGRCRPVQDGADALFVKIKAFNLFRQPFRPPIQDHLPHRGDTAIHLGE